MLAKLRQAVGKRLSVAIDMVELGALALGTGVSIIFGKVLAAALFALLAAGVATRFFRRGRKHAPEKPLAVWITIALGMVSIVETTLIVESINLPVRFDQSGFDKSNLLLVVALLIGFYCVQRALVRRMLAEYESRTALRG